MRSVLKSRFFYPSSSGGCRIPALDKVGESSGKVHHNERQTGSELSKYSLPVSCAVD
ncbi:MAG: hypothetical protein AB2L14_24725 [Candidatus Xenobiia bacterium LiM19]